MEAVEGVDNGVVGVVLDVEIFDLQQHVIVWCILNGFSHMRCLPNSWSWGPAHPGARRR